MQTNSKNSSLLRRFALTFGLGVILAAGTAQASHQSLNLVQRLQQDGRFNTLLAALDAAGLKDTVATGGTFTVLAPTDAAFAALPAGTVEGLLNDIPALRNILLYHVVAGKKTVLQLVNESTAVTLQGNPVLALSEGFKARINGQLVQFPSIPASNGWIHPLGGVLLPPATAVQLNSLVDVLALDGRFTTLIAAVQAANLADALSTGGPFTVFAPTDSAFAALPAGTVESLLGNLPALRDILLYHVLGKSATAVQLLAQRSAETLQGAEVSISLNRNGVFINQAHVLNPNVKAPNGIIHVIEAVLLPPPAEPNLLVKLQNDGRFTTLLTALQLTGLDAALASGGPLTLFAPTDDAFEKVPAATLNALLADTNALRNVLLYHVVDGDNSARELFKQRRIETLQGDLVHVSKWRSRLFVNRSEIVDKDLKASNGTVHAISQVLLPPSP